MFRDVYDAQQRIVRRARTTTVLVACLCALAVLLIAGLLSFPAAAQTAPLSIASPPSASRPAQPSIATAQLTLAPSWGNKQALPVDYVENINVRVSQDGRVLCDQATARTEYRKAFNAYKTAGAQIGFYLAADVFECRDPYYPLTQMTPDPAWRWGMPRVARKAGVPVAVAFEDGTRWTMDRSDAATLTRLAQRAVVNLRERIADAGIQPDFIFFDNCGLLVNGGVNTLDVFLGYCESVTDKVGPPNSLSLMINCSATPDLWTADEWEAVAFTAQSYAEQHRWIGFAFETAHLPVQSRTGGPRAAELAAYARLLALDCRIVWNIAAVDKWPTDEPADQRRANAAARIAPIARSMFKPRCGPYVDADWFRPAPAWATQ